MERCWHRRDVISILDFDRECLEKLFNLTLLMEKYSRTRLNILEDKVLALAFFEPSTRTRLSFETAMKRLGGSTIGFTGEEAISVSKGESIADTVRMLDSYADAIVIRHSLEGVAKYAAEIADNPVINAGDGTQNHPTQAMLDLYTIWRELGEIDGICIGILGDLKYARTVKSFIEGLTLFKPSKIYLISPPALRPRKEVLAVLEKAGLKYEHVENIDDVIRELDVLYVVRIQKERFPDVVEYERVKGSYRITVETLKNAKDTLIILHPLPRVDEIDPQVDYTRHARYFKQAAYGVPLRMALLTLIFGREDKVK
ncbi:MAG: aspartate carbamoyltransferase [Crenarchaeota archaeon]|nr:aspartate carbamoyltransferase [Thermoproteota archaeon]